MINTIDEEIGVLVKYHLTPNELFVIRILMLAREEDDSYLFKYLSIPEDSREDFRVTLVNLQDKGIINKSYKIPAKGDNFDPSKIDFNKNFIKCFYKDSFEMGKELFETYPMFGNINGCVTSIRGISKKFDSLEDFFRVYGKSIKWNPETHNEIIELVKWAKDNTQFIQFSLATFVVDRKWEELKALRDGDLTNINYNSIRML